MNKTVVVAKHNEDVNWLDQLTNCKVIIYNKGGSINRETINVENIGRESDTYLRYIIDNYNDMTDIVCFVQGHPFDHFQRTVEKINETTLFEELKENNEFIYLADRKYDFSLEDLYHPINWKIENFFPNAIAKKQIKSVIFGAGAQYIVSSSSIKRKSIGWWKNLYEYHVSFNYTDKEYHVPHVFERVWPIIWNE